MIERGKRKETETERKRKENEKKREKDGTDNMMSSHRLTCQNISSLLCAL